MRQVRRNVMRRTGIPFGRGARKIVASYIKDGRLYELHATKGWRDTKFREAPKTESVTYDFI